MELTDDTIDGHKVISLAGRIDSTAAADFEEKLLPIIDKGTPTLILDFLRVQFISSAGLRVLLLAAKKAKSQHGKLLLCNMSPEVFEVFEISGFSAIFEIHHSMTEALAALKK